MNVDRRRMLVLASVCSLAAGTVWAGQPLETESARMIKQGTFEIEGGFEHQMSSAGTEFATPLAFEYGVSDRLQLTVEPVLYTAIRDNGFRRQIGPGDLEVTLASWFVQERARVPGLALAAEVKLPTARNTRIGTGKTDYNVSLLTSKRTGRWDTHGNVGYTMLGKPDFVTVNNIVTFALAEELRVSPRFDVVAELFGNSAALSEGGGEGPVAAGSAESQITPELGGGEIVSAMGLRFHASRGLTYSLGLSVDGNKAVLVHPGLSMKW